LPTAPKKFMQFGLDKGGGGFASSPIHLLYSNETTELRSDSTEIKYNILLLVLVS